MRTPPGSEAFAMASFYYYRSMRYATSLQTECPYEARDKGRPSDFVKKTVQQIKHEQPVVVPANHYRVIVMLPVRLLPPDHFILDIIMTKREMTSLPDYIAAVQRKLNEIWPTNAPIFQQGEHCACQYMCTVRSYFLERLLEDDKFQRVQHDERKELNTVPASSSSDDDDEEPITTVALIPGQLVRNKPLIACSGVNCTVRNAIYKCPCRTVHYCCYECQKSHWSSHKIKCPLIWND